MKELLRNILTIIITPIIGLISVILYLIDRILTYENKN